MADNKIFKVRYDNIDLFKCIAMFMVISLHTGLWHTNFIVNNTTINTIQYCLRLIMEGVPIFILINGFLIMDKSFDLKKHLKKVLRIFLLLILWSIINYVLISIILKDTINFKSIITNVLTTGINSKYTGPLWFLQNLIALYLVFPIIKLIYDKDYTLFKYMFFIVTLFTFFPALIRLFECDELVTFASKYNPVSNGIFLFYFLLGGILKKNIKWFEKNKNKVVLFGITIYFLSCLYTIIKSKNDGVLIADNFLYSQIFLASIILSIYGLIYNYKDINSIINKVIKSIGTNTFGIYVVHNIINKLLATFLPINYNSAFMIRLLFCLSVFIISYLIVVLIKKIPYLKTIVRL